MHPRLPFYSWRSTRPARGPSFGAEFTSASLSAGPVLMPSASIMSDHRPEGAVPTRSAWALPSVLQPETMANTHDRTFYARLDCHYHLLALEAVDSQTPLVLTLHGFGANPGAMLHLTARLFERQPVIAALQGPESIFLGAGNRDVGYWLDHQQSSCGVDPPAPRNGIACGG